MGNHCMYSVLQHYWKLHYPLQQRAAVRRVEEWQKWLLDAEELFHQLIRRCSCSRSIQGQMRCNAGCLRDSGTCHRPWPLGDNW